MWADTQLLRALTIFDNSGDFGDFASFVAHMKELAIVRRVFFYLSVCNKRLTFRVCHFRKRTSICYWSTLVISTMVAYATHFLLCYGTKLTLRIGTGLSDGFPPGGVDAHEVRDLHFLLAAELDYA